MPVVTPLYTKPTKTEDRSRLRVMRLLGLPCAPPSSTEQNSPILTISQVIQSLPLLSEPVLGQPREINAPDPSITLAFTHAAVFADAEEKQGFGLGNARTFQAFEEASVHICRICSEILFPISLDNPIAIIKN